MGDGLGDRAGVGSMPVLAMLTERDIHHGPAGVDPEGVGLILRGGAQPHRGYAEPLDGHRSPVSCTSTCTCVSAHVVVTGL